MKKYISTYFLTKRLYSKKRFLRTPLHTVLRQLSFSSKHCVLTSSGAKVKEGSPQASHSAATQLINELSYLRSNHSDVMEAAEEAKRALESALNKHAQLKVQIEQQKNRSDGYQRQLVALQAEKTKLQSNVSALGETEL